MKAAGGFHHAAFGNINLLHNNIEFLVSRLNRDDSNEICFFSFVILNIYLHHHPNAENLGSFRVNKEMNLFETSSYKVTKSVPQN